MTEKVLYLRYFGRVVPRLQRDVEFNACVRDVSFPKPYLGRAEKPQLKLENESPGKGPRGRLLSINECQDIDIADQPNLGFPSHFHDRMHGRHAS